MVEGIRLLDWRTTAIAFANGAHLSHHFTLNLLLLLLLLFRTWTFCHNFVISNRVVLTSGSSWFVPVLNFRLRLRILEESRLKVVYPLSLKVKLLPKLANYLEFNLLKIVCRKFVFAPWLWLWQQIYNVFFERFYRVIITIWKSLINIIERAYLTSCFVNKHW